MIFFNNFHILAEGNPFPFNDPNMVKQQEAMAKLWPIGMPAMAGLFGGIGLGKGGAAGQSAAGGAQKEETSEGKGEEVKVQAPKDVRIFYYFCLF